MSNVHILLNSRDRLSGTYNSAIFGAVGQNLVQGQIKEITVSEVNFPYDISNIQNNFNEFSIRNEALGLLQIRVPPGFYTGKELAEAINYQIVAEGDLLTPPLALDQTPSVAYTMFENTFVISPPTTTDVVYSTWEINSPYVNPGAVYEGANTPNVPKDILSIMGYQKGQYGPDIINNGYYVSNDDLIYQSLVSGGSPLAFTEYIDICSPELCSYQNVSGGSTYNVQRRDNLICRLYVSNNASIRQATIDDEEVPNGVRPFIITRQFTNPRVMKWNTNNAVGNISIDLYDDCGQPLTSGYMPRNYQITFNASENPKE